MTLPGMMDPFPVEWRRQPAAIAPPPQRGDRSEPDAGRGERDHAGESDLEIGHTIAIHIA
jgi:hypothetical protein